MRGVAAGKRGDHELWKASGEPHSGVAMAVPPPPPSEMSRRFFLGVSSRGQLAAATSRRRLLRVVARNERGEIEAASVATFSGKIRREQRDHRATSMTRVRCPRARICSATKRVRRLGVHGSEEGMVMGANRNSAEQ